MEIGETGDLTTKECEHKFEFLRQEQVINRYEYHPDRLTYDVFICSKCLTYRRIHILTESQSYDRFGYDVKWRKPEQGE